MFRLNRNHTSYTFIDKVLLSGKEKVLDQFCFHFLHIVFYHLSSPPLSPLFLRPPSFLFPFHFIHPSLVLRLSSVNIHQTKHYLPAIIDSYASGTISQNKLVCKFAFSHNVLSQQQKWLHHWCQRRVVSVKNLLLLFGECGRVWKFGLERQLNGNLNGPL